jgi:hypothetical protein
LLRLRLDLRKAQIELAQLVELAPKRALAQGQHDDRNDQQNDEKVVHGELQMSIP